METGELKDFLTLLLPCRADEEIKRTARLAIRAAGVNLRNALRSRSEGLLGAKRYDDMFCRRWEYYLCCSPAASPGLRRGTMADRLP